MTLGIKHVAIAPSSGCARSVLGFSEPNPNGGSGLNGRDQRSVWEEMFSTALWAEQASPWWDGAGTEHACVPWRSVSPARTTDERVVPVWASPQEGGPIQGGGQSERYIPVFSPLRALRTKQQRGP